LDFLVPIVSLDNADSEPIRVVLPAIENRGQIFGHGYQATSNNCQQLAIL
jgi:hypothetical protein